MQPTLSDLHLNAYLSGLSFAYAQDENAFVASKVFPVVPVAHMSDAFPIYGRADFNRNTMQKRAPATESAGGGYTVGSDTYRAEVWALHKDIDDQIRANADGFFNLDSDATKYLTNQFLISKEIDFVSKYMTTGVWTGIYTGVAGTPAAAQVRQWDDPLSTPIQDIRGAKTTAQLANGGFRPNKLVIGRQVWDKLVDHPDFVDRIKYGNSPGTASKVNLDAVASLFEVNEVLIMDAIVNNGGKAAESAGLNAAESNAFIGGKVALLIYTPPSPGLLVPGAGYTFAWTGFLGATPNGSRIKSFYIDTIESTRVEIEAAYVQKVVGADMGVFFNTIVS